jgi:hypothetical protein
MRQGSIIPEEEEEEERARERESHGSISRLLCLFQFAGSSDLRQSPVTVAPVEVACLFAAAAAVMANANCACAVKKFVSHPVKVT